MKKKYVFILVIFVLSVLLPMTNVIAIDKVNCGNITAIPKKIPELTSWFIRIIQIFIPIILVILGSIDFLKGVIAQKEDEIKKGQAMFIKRIIIAILIFLIIAIVKFIVSIASNTSGGSNSNSESDNISECIDCFLNGADNCDEI